MADTVDYRYGSAYGWDHTQDVPKVGDLVVVIGDRTEYRGQIMKLCEDQPDRQTIDVTDDLKGNYGMHIRFRRRGDIRALTRRDKIIVENFNG